MGTFLFSDVKMIMNQKQTNKKKKTQSQYINPMIHISFLNKFGVKIQPEGTKNGPVLVFKYLV